MSKPKYGENYNKEKSDWVSIAFYNLTEKQMKHLDKAEEELLKAGVSFDTGYNFGEKRSYWEFDWSLKGARVKVKEKEADNL